MRLVCKPMPLLLPLLLLHLGLLVQMEGPCLVVLTDGTVAQSYIPGNDFR